MRTQASAGLVRGHSFPRPLIPLRRWQHRPWVTRPSLLSQALLLLHLTRVANELTGLILQPQMALSFKPVELVCLASLTQVHAHGAFHRHSPPRVTYICGQPAILGQGGR